MKKTLLNILLGAGLMFGAGNKSEAQKCETYNHDQDEFSEEIMSYRLGEINKKTKQNKAVSKALYKGGITIIHYSDKDNDNFHESIRIFNFNEFASQNRDLIIEDFYINKNTGAIDYNLKRYILGKNMWDKYYTEKSFINSIKENSHENLRCTLNRDYPNLTRKDLYDMDMGERVKKIINASENEDALKSITKQERSLWESHYGF